MKTTLQLTGISLHPHHQAEFLEKRPNVAWVEVQSERFFGEGGKALQQLDTVREQYPVSLHGSGLSLGSHDELNWSHLKKLKDLIARVNPSLVSEHLSWSSIHGHHLHDLLPLPYTDETINHLVLRIQQVQDYLQRQILIENIPSYITYHASTLSEHELLTQIAQQSGCSILLDITSLYVNSVNLGINTSTYIESIPSNLVQQIHLSGCALASIDDHEVLISHKNGSLIPAVWDMYRTVIKKMGRKPTIIEWDTPLPSLDLLCLEARKAENILKESYVITKYAS